MDFFLRFITVSLIGVLLFLYKELSISSKELGIFIEVLIAELFILDISPAVFVSVEKSKSSSEELAKSAKLNSVETFTRLDSPTKGAIGFTIKLKTKVGCEDLNIERTVSYFIDKKVGVVPDEAIYEQRQRVERDVATLFLVDMSASTDDILKTPGENSNSEEGGSLPNIDGKRIIDVEKEAVSLLSEVLDELGDAYSICGFSGYGREQIDYYRCKGFDKPMNDDSRAKLGGLKPCRSTRMGPSIRHAIRELVATGSRTKSLIIISDGYPQDHDYGPDRSSKTYG